MLLLVLSFAFADPDVSGRYRLAESADVLAARHEAAVQQGLAALPWAFRPIARGPIERTINNCQVFDVQLTDEAFFQHCHSKDPYEHPRADRTRTYTDSDGDEVEATLDVASARVSIAFATSDGGLRMEYMPQPDGALLLRKTMFSHHLSEPVSWEARYERVSD